MQRVSWDHRCVTGPLDGACLMCVWVKSIRHLGGVKPLPELNDPQMELTDSVKDIEVGGRNLWSARHTLQFAHELNSEEGLRPAAVLQLLRYSGLISGLSSGILTVHGQMF